VPHQLIGKKDQDSLYGIITTIDENLVVKEAMQTTSVSKSSWAFSILRWIMLLPTHDQPPGYLLAQHQEPVATCTGPAIRLLEVNHVFGFCVCGPRCRDTKARKRDFRGDTTKAKYTVCLIKLSAPGKLGNLNVATWRQVGGQIALQVSMQPTPLE
jgi:hypothetical protein